MSPLICYSSCYIIPHSLQLGKKEKLSSSSYTLNFLVQNFDYRLWWTFFVVFYSQVQEQIIELLAAT